MTTLLEAPRPKVRQGKLFYRIQEVARMTGLKPSVLRYWESEFVELCPSKDASDQRRYRQCDIEVIFAIRKLLYEDRYTIKGARAKLREELRKMRGEDKAPHNGNARNGRPTQTKTASRPKPRPAEKGDDLEQCLRGLRKEVNELLAMLA